MKRPKIVFYASKNGYRWRILSKNGKIVAAASESFASLSNCKRNLKTLKKILNDKVDVESKC